MESEVTNKYIIGFVISIIFLFSFFFLSYPRGTDNFWYFNAQNKLLQNESKLECDISYAGSILRNKRLNPTFIQNTPSYYLAYPLGVLLGAFRGWILTSGLLVCFSGFLISQVIFRSTKDPSLSLTAYIFILSLPIQVWMSFNMMQEAFFFFFGSVIVNRYLLACKPHHWILLSFISMVAGFFHPFFFLWNITLPIFFFYEKYQVISSSKLFFTIFSILSFCVIGHFLSPYVRPAPLDPDRLSYFTMMIPGEGNMVNFTHELIPTLSLQIVVSKIFLGLRSFIRECFGREIIMLGPILPLFFFSFLFSLSNIKNVFKFFFLRKAIKDDPDNSVINDDATIKLIPQDCDFKILYLRLFIITLYFLGGCFGIISLYQYQFRFALIFLAPCIVSFFIYVRFRYSQKRNTLIAGLLILSSLFVLADIFLIFKLNEEGISLQREEIAIRNFLKDVPQNDIIIYFQNKYGIFLGSAISPIKSVDLYIEDFYSTNQCQRLHKITKAQWLICHSSSQYPKRFIIANKGLPIKQYKSSVFEFDLYKLANPQ